MGHRLLELAFGWVEALGLPLAVAAWASVFLGALAMGAVLRRRDLADCRPKALAVGGVGLLAHLLDFGVTLRITPDLAMEANPIWRIVIDRFGLAVAKAARSA